MMYGTDRIYKKVEVIGVSQTGSRARSRRLSARRTRPSTSFRGSRYRMSAAMSAMTGWSPNTRLYSRSPSC